jgi:outer membrane lipoprotein-sorting protein
MRKQLSSPLLVWLLAAAWVQATEGQALPDPRQPGLSPSQKLEALIERVRLEQAQVQTLEANFIQLKESSMLLEPEEARGIFSYAAPDRVLWDFESPNPISILIADEAMTTWYRDLGQVETMQVGRHSRKVLQYLSAGTSMDDLLQYFTVTLTLPSDRAAPYILELSPKFDKVAKRVQGMSVWIDPARHLPVRLRYVEADGDVTDLRFENFVVNGALPDNRFDLDLPQEVDVRVVDLDRRSDRR